MCAYECVKTQRETNKNVGCFIQKLQLLLRVLSCSPSSNCTDLSLEKIKGKEPKKVWDPPNVSGTVWIFYVGLWS